MWLRSSKNIAPNYYYLLKIKITFVYISQVRDLAFRSFAKFFEVLNDFVSRSLKEYQSVMIFTIFYEFFCQNILAATIDMVKDDIINIFF